MTDHAGGRTLGKHIHALDNGYDVQFIRTRFCRNNVCITFDLGVSGTTILQHCFNETN